MIQAVFALSVREGAWIIHVHGAHIPQGQRHIHISRKRLRGKYSWNVDGTRHDEHRFPAGDKGLRAAKEIAARHLGVSASTLSFLTAVPTPTHVVIEIDHFDEPERAVVVESPVAKRNAQPWLLVLTGRRGRLHLLFLDVEVTQEHTR